MTIELSVEKKYLKKHNTPWELSKFNSLLNVPYERSMELTFSVIQKIIEKHFFCFIPRLWCGYWSLF